jgi:tetratricopeptide (TPR) repeat protein
MSNRTCFVIMPIKKSGTPEHEHFKAIFNLIKPICERRGYLVIRADDVQKSGAITKDIVTRLGESDLVIADLTDLNPNVFYELGVRHALRGRGTVMILDEARTSDIPFDLSAYRVIKFVGQLTGISTLETGLDAFLTGGSDAEHTALRDNPVHDWFPMLPLNVIGSAAESNEGPLRGTIKQLQDRLGRYEQAYGVEGVGQVKDRSPLSAILSAITDAEDGLLPGHIIEQLDSDFKERNIVGFLNRIRVVVERNIRLSPTAFLTIAGWASILDLNDVSKALFDQALAFYPTDVNIRRRYLSRLAHSDDPADRKKAREELPDLMAARISGDKVIVTNPKRVKGDLGLVGILLDAYHNDNLHAEALQIADKFFAAFPDRTEIIRNYARALETSGRPTEAMDFYRKAIFAKDVDDTSAVWLGSELHNQENNRLAAEVYAYACLLDINDARNFSHLASELATCIYERALPLRETATDEAITSMEVQDVITVASCALSCRNVDSEAAERIRRALRLLDISDAELDNSFTTDQRLQCAKTIYGLLKSKLTTPGEEYSFDRA